MVMVESSRKSVGKGQLEKASSSESMDMARLNDVQSMIAEDALGKQDIDMYENEFELIPVMRLKDQFSGGTPFTKQALSTLVNGTRITPSTALNLHEVGQDVLLTDILNLEFKYRADSRRKTDSDGDEKFKSLKVRYRDMDNERVIRAVVSERYGIIDNVQVMDMVCDALSKHSSADHSNYEVIRPYDDHDNIRMSILFQDSNNKDGLRAGFTIRNSEVRKMVFSIESYLYRGFCFNGMIWGKQNRTNVRKKHLGEIDTKTLEIMVHEQIKSSLQESTKMTSLFVQSQSIKIDSDLNGLITYLGDKHNLTMSQQVAWRDSYFQEGDSEINAQALINGLTRAAHEYRMEESARYHLESVAGSLLTPATDISFDGLRSYWDTVSSASAKIPDSRMKHLLEG